jgi:glycosyltransferase involved in cell wall biosynthesis
VAGKLRSGNVRISVAMCTFNGSRYLGGQLASIAAQQRLPDELVVRDDASTDGTAAMLTEFKRVAPFPVHLELGGARLGAVRNFERVIERCDGNVIALADQDDVWLRHKLAALEMAFARDPGLMMVFSDARLIAADGRRLPGTVWQVNGFHGAIRHQFAEDPLRTLLGRSLVPGFALAFRACVRDVLLPFPPELDEAYEPMFHDRWMSLVFAATGRIRALDEPLVSYRLHRGQQIGIRGFRLRQLTSPRLWKLAVFGVSRGERDQRHVSRVAQQRALICRLRTSAAEPEAAIAVIAESSRHLQARAALPAGRLRRVATIVREWRRGAYRAWSLGAVSAISDFLR